MNNEALRGVLEYYRDLGFTTLYRRNPADSTEPRTSVSGLPLELPPLEPAGDTMLKIIEDIGDCKRCRLHQERNKIVFGVGNEQSPLVFVGEGPGADEDAQGIPFVGRAGNC